mgnify:CR=1 FL=1
MLRGSGIIAQNPAAWKMAGGSTGLSMNRLYAHWPATIDHGNPLLLGVDHQALGDTIAGKGHETTQITGDNVVAFDDRIVATRALKGRA